MPKYEVETVDFLLFLDASINGTVFFIFAFMAIKMGKRELLQKLIYAALILSIFFLLSYVFHHATFNTQDIRQ